jgi:hypothetical protein
MLIKDCEKVGFRKSEIFLVGNWLTCFRLHLVLIFLRCSSDEFPSLGRLA